MPRDALRDQRPDEPARRQLNADVVTVTSITDEPIRIRFDPPAVTVTGELVGSRR